MATLQIQRQLCTVHRLHLNANGDDSISSKLWRFGAHLEEECWSDYPRRCCWLLPGRDRTGLTTPPATAPAPPASSLQLQQTPLEHTQHTRTEAELKSLPSLIQYISLQG